MLHGRLSSGMLAMGVVGTAIALGCVAGARADGTMLSFREPPAEPAKGGLVQVGVQPSDATTCPAIPTQADDALHVYIDPTVWYVGPSGKFSLPVTSGTGPGGFTTQGDKIRVNDLDLDTTRLRPAGSIALNTGRWRFSFTGSEYELARAASAAATAGRLGSVAFAQGDRLKLDFSFGMYEISAGYRVADYDFRPGCTKQDFVVDAYVLVHAFVGARIYDVDISAEGVGGTSPGARAAESNVFAEPIIGARAEAVIARDFSLVLQLSAGGLPLYATTSYSFDISLAFEWRPMENMGIQIGWRQLAFSLTDGKELDRFEYTGRMAGLFAGVTIRF